jgi:hypothetical protein
MSERGVDLQDNIILSGRLRIEVFRRGELERVIEDDNLVVNAAKNQLARLIGGDTAGRSIATIGFGEGADAADPDDTGLAPGAYTKPVASVSYPATGHAAFSWALAEGEANGMGITELGLVCADGVLFSRKVRAAINKDADISLSGTWTIIF